MKNKIIQNSFLILTALFISGHLQAAKTINDDCEKYMREVILLSEMFKSESLIKSKLNKMVQEDKLNNRVQEDKLNEYLQNQWLNHVKGNENITPNSIYADEKKLVKECVEYGLDITAMPGANAAITGLVLSGLPTNRFLFAGFLNSKTRQRCQELAELSNVPTTLIFYESAKRLTVTLKDMVKQLGDRPAAIARELTKRHEEIRRDTLSKLAAHYLNVGAPKGEIVIVVGPPLKKTPLSNKGLDDLVLKQLQTLSVRDTTIKIAIETGLSKRQIYSRALRLLETQSQKKST